MATMQNRVASRWLELVKHVADEFWKTQDPNAVFTHDFHSRTLRGNLEPGEVNGLMYTQHVSEKMLMEGDLVEAARKFVQDYQQNYREYDRTKEKPR